MRPARTRGLLDGDWYSAITDAPTPGITAAERRAAQVTVARHALSVEDCAVLLAMLGIAGVR